MTEGNCQQDSPKLQETEQWMKVSKWYNLVLFSFIEL